jgi:hypothetical protein
MLMKESNRLEACISNAVTNTVRVVIGQPLHNYRRVRAFCLVFV